MSEEKPKRGRPRMHKDRHQAWKQRTGFEQSEKRRQYKAEWARRKQQEKKQTESD